jgi:hypothetical protein
MKKFQYLLTPVLILAISLGACTSKTEKTLSALDVLLKEIQEKYVPDNRIEWWEINALEKEGQIVLEGDLTSKEALKVLTDQVQEQFPEVEMEVLLLPESDSGTLVNGLVNNSVIHLRREPSSTKELITQARLGAPVRILKDNGGKSLIQIADGYIGWVNTAEVIPLDKEGLSAYREAEKVVFTAQYGISYSEPDPESLPVTDLVIGNILVKISELSEYTQVNTPTDAWAGC